MARRPERKRRRVSGCHCRFLLGLKLKVPGHSLLATRHKPDGPGQLSGQAGNSRQMSLSVGTAV